MSHRCSAVVNVSMDPVLPPGKPHQLQLKGGRAPGRPQAAPAVMAIALVVIIVMLWGI